MPAPIPVAFADVLRCSVETPSGWDHILRAVCRVCRDCRAQIGRVYPRDGALVVVIAGTTPERVRGAVQVATELSRATCEQCGAPGTERVRIDRAMRPVCEACR